LVTSLEVCIGLGVAVGVVATVGVVGINVSVEMLVAVGFEKAREAWHWHRLL
jgi:hypothetical protein